MTASGNLRVNGERLWRSLMRMAMIGATEKGGNCRLALSDPDREARDLFVSWAREAGCTITIDKMGSIFARRAGSDDTLAPVMMGSHLDTQPTGGRFDGVLGVLSALEVIRTLNDLDYRSERPLEIAMWTNEEGSRFAPAMLASGVFAGEFSLEFGHSRADRDGRSVGAELERIGYLGDEPVGGRDIHAFFEVHIEQGPILEEEEKTIGIVTDAQGVRWYEVTLQGVESHAGPTPMDRRRDALVGAARIVERVNEIGLAHAPLACATVGMMEVHPNSRNVIPGRVFLTIDLRHPDDGVLDAMEAEFRARSDEIAAAAGLDLECEKIFAYAPVAFDPGCIEAVREAAAGLGLGAREIVSGAGHDACYISRVAPSAMIFTPCIGGISHNEAEDIKPEWAAAGADVLLRAVIAKAGA